MSYLTPSNVMLALLAIVGLIGVGFGTRAIILNRQSPVVADNPRWDDEEDDDDYDDEDDDDYDDEDDDEDDDIEFYEPSPGELAESPGEITLMSRVDWIAKRDFARMQFRAENPRLFSDTWYDDSRKAFSQWAADVYRENSLAA